MKKSTTSKTEKPIVLLGRLEGEIKQARNECRYVAQEQDCNGKDVEVAEFLPHLLVLKQETIRIKEVPDFIDWLIKCTGYQQGVSVVEVEDA